MHWKRSNSFGIDQMHWNRYDYKAGDGCVLSSSWYIENKNIIIFEETHTYSYNIFVLFL